MTNPGVLLKEWSVSLEAMAFGAKLRFIHYELENLFAV
jgi:hypothetical protein